MDWQAVFFDFDGVILDSVHVKTEAFAQMFRPYGSEVERQVVNYHVRNGGISRFEKFRYFYGRILGKHITEKDLQKLGSQFSDLVLHEVLKAPFMDGSWETLEKLQRNNTPAYVVSGTPNEEIEYIVRERRLTEFFREVHGSPREKHEIINDILNRHGYEKSRCMFIGDAMSDYKASRSTGVSFVGIVKKGESSPFPKGTLISHEVTPHPRTPSLDIRP